VYIKGIQKMCGDNKQSLEISYVHLSSTVPPLARFIVEHPDLILPLLHKELMSVTSTLAPNYEDIHPEVFVRVFNMPLRDSIRDLRQFHVNSLIRVWGVAVRRSGVFPQLAIAHYRCSCGESIGPVTVGSDAPAIARCPACQRQATNMALDTSETIFRNYQKVTLQEAPGSVPAGRVPRQVEVILLNDLIDKCAPGEEIEVTGVFKHAPMQNNHKAFGSPTFATILEANHVGKSAIIASSVTPTAADESEILSLSRMPKIDDMIARSIAPSIHGHEHIKRSIALSLFGGVPKENDETKNRLRGDINVLLLGDPGTAKSQFLKYTQKIATRAVFTTGKGASAVGLTASVRTDPMTGQFTLEGGAMVLSDQVRFIRKRSLINYEYEMIIIPYLIVYSATISCSRRYFSLSCFALLIAIIIAIAIVFIAALAIATAGHVSDRRVRQNVRPGPHLDPRGHGAADDLDRQGRHRVHAQGALLRHRRRQPRIGTVQPHAVVPGAGQPVGPHSVAFRRALRGARRGEPRGRPPPGFLHRQLT